MLSSGIVRKTISSAFQQQHINKQCSASVVAISNTFQRRDFGTALGYHVDTEDNKATTKFDFTDDNYKFVEKVLSKYPTTFKASGIIPLLDLAQRQSGGWLPLAAMDKVAQITETPAAQVYEVATFYTMFNRTRRGKYFMQLCGTTPCMICGSEEIKNVIEKHLSIKNGETSKDGLFTLLEVECLGACANAPMLQLNDDYYECLTPESTIALLEACKNGEAPPMGKWGSLPMNGQVSCEGPLGKTSLFGDPVFPKIREGGFDGKVDPKDVKVAMAY